MCKPQIVSQFIFSSHARFLECVINLFSGVAGFLTRDLLLAYFGSVSLPSSPTLSMDK